MNQDPIQQHQQINFVMNNQKVSEESNQYTENHNNLQLSNGDNQVITVEASQDINQENISNNVIDMTKSNQTQQLQTTQKQKALEPQKQMKKKENTKKQEPAITINLFQKKTDQALELKKQGNVFFKNKDYIRSLQKYQQALKVLDPNQYYGATHAQCLKMAEVSSQLLNNIGTCYFNSLDWFRAEIYYTQAITINPKYIKALLKRSLCRYELKKYHEALQDIKAAYNLDKSNTQIHSAYQKILEAYNISAAQQKQKAKQITGKMFKSQAERNKQKLQQQRKKKQAEKEAKQSDFGISDWLGITAGAGILAYSIYKIFSK